MAAEKLPVPVACRNLSVAESGYYAHRKRTPSERSVRHAMLTDLIIPDPRQAPPDLRRPADACLAHPRPQRPGRAPPGRAAPGRAAPGRAADAPSGPRGPILAAEVKRIRADDLATDLVERNVTRAGPNQLWVTDITEHPTKAGKVYRCVILDTYSRCVIGWSIDASPTGAVVPDALGMAIDSRLQKNCSAGTISGTPDWSSRTRSLSTSRSGTTGNAATARTTPKPGHTKDSGHSGAVQHDDNGPKLTTGPSSDCRRYPTGDHGQLEVTDCQPPTGPQNTDPARGGQLAPSALFVSTCVQSGSRIHGSQL